MTHGIKFPIQEKVSQFFWLSTGQKSNRWPANRADFAEMTFDRI